MSIRSKLTIGFIGIVLFVGLIGVLGLNQTRQTVKSFEIGEHFQSIVSAATEVSSYAKRAEGHLMLYLTLYDEVDREKFFLRHESLLEQFDILSDNVQTTEGKVYLDEIKASADTLLTTGTSLFEAYDNDMDTTGTFELINHEELVHEMHDAASSIRKQGVDLTQYKLDMQTEETDAALSSASSTQRNIFITMITVTLAALFIGYFLSRTISKPIMKLRDDVIEFGRGDLTRRAEIKSKDEIGELANSFNQMSNAIQKRNDDLKSMNEKLQRSDAELQELVAELSRSNAELQEFAYVASHDLQEPLRMIASYMQLLEKRYKDKLDTDADEFIAFAVDGANRMQNLINDLLAYSRVGTRGKDFALTDCKSILDQALANLKTAIEESNAVISHDYLPSITADDSQLVQLFQNLIGNAIKFRNSEPPHIHISAEQRDSEWLFSVRDNGIGIDMEFADRIFGIFQRLHSRNEYTGTGIGLAICKNIVERHGGRIWVESQNMEGSTFYFTIPAFRNRG